MIQHFDLHTIFPLDSMHDQVITDIYEDKDKLEFHFNELNFSFMSDYAPASSYIESHHEFHSCNIVFSDPDSPYAVIYQGNQSIFTGQFIAIGELIDFMGVHDYRIEISNMLCGYELIVFQGTFINRQGHYCDRCIIYIPAKQTEYVWE